MNGTFPYRIISFRAKKEKKGCGLSEKVYFSCVKSSEEIVSHYRIVVRKEFDEIIFGKFIFRLNIYCAKGP